MRVLGDAQGESPLEDLRSLRRVEAAPTMRDTTGEPPAKDMG